MVSPRAAFKQHVIRQHHRRATVLLEYGEDMLEKIELLVAGGCPEIIAVDDERFLGRLAGLVDDGNAAFFAERRICEDHVIFAMFAGKRIFHPHWNFVLQSGTAILAVSLFPVQAGSLSHFPDAVKEKIHAAKPSDAVHQFDAEERARS